MKKSFLHPILLIISILTVLLGSSCYAPENIEITYDDIAKDEMYQFDIMMLSEWAGHILPETMSVHLYADNEYYYFLDEVSIPIVNICPNNPDDCLLYMDKALDPRDPIPNPLQRPLTLLNAESITSADRFKIHPFPFNPNMDVECIKDTEGQNSSIVARFNRIYSKSISEYICTYTQSGAISLRQTWDLLKADSNHDHQIYVGNGDSFGVSQRASALFNDLPTPQMLSLSGFQVDTFGNHSFDSKIDYLQDIINYATPEVSNHQLGYHYVASNLSHSTNLIQWQTHYTTTIPSSTPGHDGLKVALIGALDSSVLSTTKTGSFGSIDIDSEMCSIVNEIELAYNENARAFFILGHILRGSESYSHLLDAIFTFTEPLISANIKNDGATDLPFLSQCESKLVVPLDRLEAAFGVRVLSKLDFKNQNIKEQYAKIIDEIRLEIFNSIIGIIGEESNASTVQVYFHENHVLENGEKGIIWNKSTSNSITADDYTNNDLLTLDTNFCNTTQIFDSHPCYRLTFSDQNTLNAYDHPIYYIQIPSSGTNTLQMQVTAKLNPSIDNGKNVASSYSLHTDKIMVYPVVSSFDDAQIKYDKNTIDITAPSFESCKNFFEQELPNVIHGLSTSCSDLYNGLSQAKHIFTTLSDMKTKEDDEGINYSKLFSTCHKEFSNYVLNEIDPEEMRTNLKLASSFWSCLYTASSNYTCPTTNSFYYPVAFKFNNYTQTTMQQDRSQTTCNTNIISNGFFNYMNTRDLDTKFDISIINSGTLRDGNLSKITETILSFMIPFDNKLVSAKLTPQNIVNIITVALNKSYEYRNQDYGGYPSVSRMAIAYKPQQIDAGKMEIIVTEIWKTDQYGALTELLYLSDIHENYFANYSYSSEDKKLVATFDSHVPWLCLQQSRIMCNQVEEGMKFSVNEEDGHFYSPNSQQMLSHSYLVTAGDEYPNNFGVTHEAIAYYETSFRQAVFNYYNGNKDTEGELDANECSDSNTSNYMTLDNLTPETMDCILYVNHFYDASRQDKSRWIQLASDSIKADLEDRCQVSKLSQ